MQHARKITSLLILLLGLALIVRSVIVAGAFLSTGLFVGAAFSLYGAIRLHYLRKAP